MWRWIVVAALLLPGAAAAEIYKWKDAQGRVHYGDRPRQGAQEVRPRQSSSGLGVAADEAAAQQRLLQTRQEERQAEQKAKAAAAAEREKRQRNCMIARDNYESTRSAGYLYEPQLDGGRRVLSDEERRAAEAEAERAMRQWCDG